MQSRILPVNSSKLGKITTSQENGDFLDTIDIDLDTDSPDGRHLYQAAQQLRTSSIPIAFPTETVYGLGADATRSEAVRGIYKAKQRPSDNPLIVHFASLKQLRSLLKTSKHQPSVIASLEDGTTSDPIPSIYKPLISRFWPGPLTIILPNPDNSTLAPEVTAGLTTFGARIPRHLLALALIQLAGVPVAAPSANASTKPSPTAAEHVAYDLDGRIETILDGGPCDVGVESTVVDGLSDPPLILRPGGISIEQIRSCPGWENTQVGYQNVAEAGSKPKAPGMKYRHYSPKATVVLYEAGKTVPTAEVLYQQGGALSKVGVIRTKHWLVDTSRTDAVIHRASAVDGYQNGASSNGVSTEVVAGFAGMLEMLHNASERVSTLERHTISDNSKELHILDIGLGADTRDIARGIFSALRDLDRQEVGAILVEGIDDSEGDTAAAVMNRLRKAAEVRVAES